MKLGHCVKRDEARWVIVPLVTAWRCASWCRLIVGRCCVWLKPGVLVTALPLCLCRAVCMLCWPACMSVSPRRVIKVGILYYLLFSCAFIWLWGFILPFSCSAGSDGEPEGASSSGGRVLDAVELRGMLLVFVYCCSFPSIALAGTLCLLLCCVVAERRNQRLPLC